jgi:hypothetical protein
MMSAPPLPPTDARRRGELAARDTAARDALFAADRLDLADYLASSDRKEYEE